MNWWQRVRQRTRLERELDAELRFHLESQVQDRVARGMSEADARRQVRLEFGGLDQVKEDCRDARGTRWVDDAIQDLRFGARLLMKDRPFTAAAVIALALGIGVNTTVFTIVNAMVLRGLPVPNPDRIVAFADRGGGPLAVSWRDVEDWRGATVTFAGLAAFVNTSMTIGDEGLAPEIFSGSYVSPNAFRLLHEAPILGRDFLAEDDRPGAPAVVMLGHAVWTRRYGGDPAVVGRTIRINNVPSTVVGVMPAGFRFPLVDELWQPFAQMAGLERQKRDARTIRAFGRLADRTRMAQAQAELDTLAARMTREYPDTNRDFRPLVVPYTGTATDQPIFLALAGAVVFVLLIACANVANLLLARASTRARELSIRASIGATASRIVRQLLVESVLVAALAGAIGFLLAVTGVRLYAYSVEGINFAYWYRDRWTMDGRVFAFFATVSLGATIVFGLAPALHVAKANVHDVLKDAGRAATSGRARRWTFVLTTVELAFTLILLAGAGLMMRSFVAIYRADRAIDASRVIAASFRLPNQKYRTPEQRIEFYRRLEERLSGVGAISSATLASRAPFIGAPLRSLSIDGRTTPAGATLPNVTYLAVGSRYFDTLGVPLLAGRPFTEIDGTAGHESAIVNQRFVAIHFPNTDPIGVRIRLSTPAAGRAGSGRDVERPWLTIIGVSPTVRQQFLSEIDPVVYVPQRSDPAPSAWLLARGASEPAALTPLLRQEMRALDPDLPLSEPVMLDVLMAQSRWGHRVFGMMFSVFAAIALVLSAVGLYAVTAYSVSQRTQEIGVRMALGAQAQQVVWLFVRRGMVPLAIGVTIGLAGAFGVGRLLRSLLVQTGPTDPLTLIAICALLVVVAAAACVIPARRATRLDPVSALRYE